MATVKAQSTSLLDHLAAAVAAEQRLEQAQRWQRFRPVYAQALEAHGRSSQEVRGIYDRLTREWDWQPEDRGSWHTLWRLCGTLRREFRARGLGLVTPAQIGRLATMVGAVEYEPRLRELGLTLADVYLVVLGELAGWQTGSAEVTAAQAAYDQALRDLRAYVEDPRRAVGAGEVSFVHRPLAPGRVECVAIYAMTGTPLGAMDELLAWGRQHADELLVEVH
ncbi:MAG: hypothetical protein QN197_13270 [Armatimonadota bacterium]|nr:hypothetical protein [Armatimonadota bacterium]MDR7574350.1 hypothetical protein [Armatimonadota bacterium]